jgi:hypothetical protein
MGFAKIKGRLPSRKGQRVRFGAPKDVRGGGGGALVGTIRDEVWADESINHSPHRAANGAHDWGDYSFFAQLIELDDGRHLIRLGYYRRRAGEDWWEFSGQWTICADWRIIKSLMGGLAAKPEWFCDRPQLPV